MTPPATSTAICKIAATTPFTVAAVTAVATPYSTVVASTIADFIPVLFHPVVPALLLVILWAFVAIVTALTAVEALNPTGITLCVHGNPTAHHGFSTRRCASQVRVDASQYPLDVFQSEVALAVAAVAHVLVPVREALQDPVRERLVRDDLPMFVESTQRSIHRLQPDVRVLFGLQFAVMLYFVAGHMNSIGNTVINIHQRQPRRSPVASATIY